MKKNKSVLILLTLFLFGFYSCKEDKDPTNPLKTRIFFYTNPHHFSDCECYFDVFVYDEFIGTIKEPPSELQLDTIIIPSPYVIIYEVDVPQKINYYIELVSSSEEKRRHYGELYIENLNSYYPVYINTDCLIQLEAYSKCLAILPACDGSQLASSVQCFGIAASTGVRCNNKTLNRCGYCYLHTAQWDGTCPFETNNACGYCDAHTDQYNP